METILAEWLSLLLRWAHVMAGIMWIGTSFFFIWLDASLEKRPGKGEEIAGESWLVHGGGFYQAEKYLVAPAELPKTLHWFRYEAYLTWLTGFLLLATIYYWGAEAFLVNPQGLSQDPKLMIAASLVSLALGWLAYDRICRSLLGQKTAGLAVAVFLLIIAFAWTYLQLFSARAAFVHVGALVGTIMAANVFVIIIPNQKKAVAALIAGKRPEPQLGQQAKQRSLHNNYLTLPVVLMMLSHHYPILYAGGQGWLVIAGIVLLGGLVRLAFNRHDEGKRDWWIGAAVTAAGVVLIGLIGFTAIRSGSSGDRPAPFAEVRQIIDEHCLSCHSQTPMDEAFEAAPGDVVFDRDEDIRRQAPLILKQAVLSDAMPLGNKTSMQKAERQLLGSWIKQGAKLE